MEDKKLETAFRRAVREQTMNAMRPEIEREAYRQVKANMKRNRAQIKKAVAAEMGRLMPSLVSKFIDNAVRELKRNF